jgi:hypothetical protein
VTAEEHLVVAEKLMDTIARDVPDEWVANRLLECARAHLTAAELRLALDTQRGD